MERMLKDQGMAKRYGGCDETRAAEEGSLAGDWG
eukprot:SAG25_NODE_13058_length_272_cov_0.514451_1_plen_33_part_10